MGKYGVAIVGGVGGGCIINGMFHVFSSPVIIVSVTTDILRITTIRVEGSDTCCRLYHRRTLCLIQMVQRLVD